MSFNLLAWAKATVRLDGETINLGSLEKPVSISVTGNVHERIETIANSANATIYSDELGDFTFLGIVSDFNTRVQVTDTASDTFSLPLLGTGVTNKYGLPLMLGDDTTNTGASINSVQVFNNSGSTAKVKLVIVE